AAAALGGKLLSAGERRAGRRVRLAPRRNERDRAARRLVGTPLRSRGPDLRPDGVEGGAGGLGHIGSRPPEGRTVTDQAFGSGPDILPSSLACGPGIGVSVWIWRNLPSM